MKTFNIHTAVHASSHHPPTHTLCVHVRAPDVLFDTFPSQLRMDVEPGGYETWVKHRWGWSVVKAKLEKYGHGGKTTSNLTGGGAVRVHKRRRTSRSVGPGSAQGEITELLLEFDEGGEEGRTEAWVTVSVEGEIKAVQDATSEVLTKCKSIAAGGDAVVMGYPAFIVHRVAAANPHDMTNAMP
jgi:hypothetical protein